MVQQIVLALIAGWAASKVLKLLLGTPLVSAAAITYLLSKPEFTSLIELPDAHETLSSAPLRLQRDQNVRRRAQYLLAAVRRMSTAIKSGDLSAVHDEWDAERTYLQQHLTAVAKRTAAAAQVAGQLVRQQVQPTGVNEGRVKEGDRPLLGWYAVLDSHTSEECAEADGRNFDPAEMPLIGYPGAVHIHCRCVAGPPFDTTEMADHIHSDQPDRAVAAASSRHDPVQLTSRWTVTYRS